jgi:signal transduction histidine kinase
MFAQPWTENAGDVLRKLSPSRSLTAPDLVSFRQQESILIVLNLLILAVLFSLHWYFAAFWGKPTTLLTMGVVVGFVLKIAEWLWLQRLARPLTPAAQAALTWGSITLNVTLASMLGLLTDQEDTPYFVLMVVAVLEAAFRFRLFSIVAVIAVVDASLFWQVWRYFAKHPPVDVGEYFEAGITSLLFAIVGVLVWLLLADLRRKEDRLANNVLELEQAREQLLRDAKLAAMGRLSSAIAHEIRNPVAMIASSIATARELNGPEREEMFEIASDEAKRLSELTTQFLDYASTRPPNLALTSVADTLAYVADASRAHASQKGIHFALDAPETLMVRADEGQLHQALMNLLLNAVDSSPEGGTILLRGRNGNHEVCIQVENAGSPIPEAVLSRIFEPFFTTKPRGTGLGLAIARNIARAQGGDVTLAANEASRICFSLNLPMPNEGAQIKKA